MHAATLAPARLGLLGLALVAGGCRGEPGPRSDGPEPLGITPLEIASGASLYGRHCAVCHGEAGRGDGPAAPYLFPPARDFAQARFRLVSTTNRVPSDRDLVDTLRRGIPGSAMPAFGWLPETELGVLAAEVRGLAYEGLRRDLADEARAAGDELLAAEAERIARERLTPGPPIPRPPEVPDTDAARSRGAAVYARHCSSCHAEDGTAVTEPRFDEDGTLNWARDLTAGFLKGGDAPYALRCRIRAGMPGTAMPPTELAAEDELALLAFLDGLIPPGTAERLVHRRERLVAARVQRVPEEPDDEAWSAAGEIDVVLAPLRWKSGAVLGASLAALHDGEEVALRLSWADDTGEIRIFAESSASDGAALQVSGLAEPALFGMGTPEHPTSLWHWQALRLEAVAGALDLLDPTPHAVSPTDPGRVRADVPLYRHLLSRIEPSDRADALVAEGIPSVHAAPRESGLVRARARWADGRWSVVFARPLAAADDSVALALGRAVQVACAVWNGAAGDAGAEKSISIWQELVLEP